MTSLARKLQMKPRTRWLIYNPPRGYLKFLEPLPEEVICTSKPGAKIDGIQVFVRTKAELSSALKVIVPLLKPATLFWITYPKQRSGMASDLKMGDWDEMKALKWQGVSSISVDEHWAGSRFRPEGQAKISGTGKEEIRKSELAAYIDVDNKIVTLPPDANSLLRQHPSAFSFYQQLSYSNRKEYVLWILTAKKEKTRAERLTRTIEKLAAGKKNPAEK